MRLSVALAVSCLSMIALSRADEVDAAIKKYTSIPAQGLGAALQQLARERDVQLVYRSEIVGNHRTGGASGEFTFDEALTQLLSGTGLTFQYLDDQAITIVPLASSPASSRSAEEGPRIAGVGSPASAARSEPSGDGKLSEEADGKSVWSRFRLTQVDQAATESTQNPGGSRSSADSKPAIEEIIVTAQKREERLQDVPISIAVIGSEEIERRGLIGMEDYLRSIPGVNQIDQGSINNAIIIRGISTSPTFENFSAGTTVATYFDETPITGAAGLNAAGIDVRPVDIERIEVLRGPQGTAYGSSSLGGTLRIIPAKPKLDGFDAKAVIALSDTHGGGRENTMLQGVVNVPVLEDRLTLRAVGYRYDESGVYRNIAGTDAATLGLAATFGLTNFVSGHVQSDVGQMVSTGGRLAALWRVSDNLEFSANYLTQKIEMSGQPVATTATYDQIRIPVPPASRVRGQSGEAVDTGIDLVNLVANYDFGWSTLTSTASWVDGKARSALTQNGLGPLPSLNSPSDFESFTAESRMASQLSGPFQFLAGLFYEDVENFSSQVAEWPGSAATNPLVTTPSFFASNARYLTQRAAFGELSYDLTEKLTATVGGRYFTYDKDNRRLQEGGLLGFSPGTRIPLVPIGAGVPTRDQTDEDDSTFKAQLGYKATQESLFYASWAEGFRLGRPDTGLPAGSCDLNGDGLLDSNTGISIESTRHIRSDFLSNYEIGAKLGFLDRRLVVDAAAFHIEWTDLPITLRAACTTSSLTYTANAGEATSDGVEFQAAFHATDGLRIDFGAGYTQAELSEDAPSLGASKGARLPASAEWSANLAVQYEFDLAGYRAFVRADSFYTSEFYGNLLEQTLTEAGDYVKIDARAGVAIRNLSVELFARNLTNEDAFTFRGTSNANAFFGHRLRPRTIGLQLSYDF